MDWIVKISVGWISISSVIVATGWYAANVCPRVCPNWWKRVIIDDMPTFKKTDPHFTFRTK